MFSFFESIALESLGNFRIAFAVSLTRHGQIHAYFAAFTVEMSEEILDHLFVAAFGYTDLVFGDEV